MGMPAHAPTYYTVDDVLAFPNDGNRYELVYGKLLVSPSPSFLHQKILSRLFYQIISYCERECAGQALCAPADLTWGRKDVIAQPDIFVIGPEDAHVHTWAEVRRVPLIAEVLSPSTKHYDRFDKRGLYRDRLVDVYWIVDPVEELAEVWTPASQSPVVERERLVWHASGAQTSLIVDLPALFAR